MNLKIAKSTLLSAFIGLAVATNGGLVNAAGSHSDGHGDKKGHAGKMPHGHTMSFGEPGKASEVSRTVEIKMLDNYYEPAEIEVKAGETIRFAIKNLGEFVHEFNIGTASMHAAHQKEMVMMVEHGVIEPDKINHEKMKMDMGGGRTMEHNDPNSVLLEPGKSGEVIWKFAEAKGIEFACNVPGHYDAGMMGPLKVHH
jgi:uncharacterized cupredoxin-like copper-binding protein